MSEYGMSWTRYEYVRACIWRGMGEGRGNAYSFLFFIDLPKGKFIYKRAFCTALHCIA